MLLIKFLWMYLITGMLLSTIILIGGAIIGRYVFKIDFTNEEQMAKFIKLAFSEREDLVSKVTHNYKNRKSDSCMETFIDGCYFFIVEWPISIPLLCRLCYGAYKNWNKDD